MFEDLDWKGAFRRAAFAAALYLVFVYIMSVAFPDTFGVGTNLISTVVIAVVFFLVYAPLFAFAERRKRRRIAEMKAQKKGKKPGAETRETEPDEEGAGTESLKGRSNPNTSRRKAARRRRR